MEDITLEYQSPWADDRARLEQAAIITSWDETTTAKRLLEFPDSMWMKLGHLHIVQAVRQFVDEGSEVSPLRIRSWLKDNRPDGIYAFDQCFLEHSENFLEYSGQHTQVIKDLHNEYGWELGGKTVTTLAKGLRKGRLVDWFTKARQLLMALAPVSDEGGVRKMSDLIRERLKAHQEGEIEDERIETGIGFLDSFLGGLFPDRMYLLAAGPGAGKTTLAYQVAKNGASRGVRGHFWQADMPAEEMAERHAIMDVGKPVERFTGEDFARAHELAQLADLITVDDRTLTVDEWESRAASLKAKHPELALCFTDFAQQVDAGKGNAAEVGERIAKAGRRMAKDNKFAHFLLQQPTQEYENDKWPRKNHIRGGKMLEAASHAVLFLHYPHAFDPSFPADYTQIHVLKNRKGPCGIIPVQWERANYVMRPWPGGKVLNPGPGLRAEDERPGQEQRPTGRPSKGGPEWEELEMEDIPL